MEYLVLLDGKEVIRDQRLCFRDLGVSQRGFYWLKWVYLSFNKENNCKGLKFINMFKFMSF